MVGDLIALAMCTTSLQRIKASLNMRAGLLSVAYLAYIKSYIQSYKHR
jgi:hypothetical protein